MKIIEHVETKHQAALENDGPLEFYVKYIKSTGGKSMHSNSIPKIDEGADLLIVPHECITL